MLYFEKTAGFSLLHHMFLFVCHILRAGKYGLKIMLDIKPVHGTRRIVYVCMCTVAKENVDLVAVRENKKGQLKVPILQRELSLFIHIF